MQTGAIERATEAMGRFNIEEKVPQEKSTLFQIEDYLLLIEIPVLEMYHKFCEEKVISVIEYSLASCSYYPSKFELKFLREKELFLLMLVHGLSTEDICLSSLTANLVAAAPLLFSQFTPEDQVTWLTASHYCDEKWIKSAVEQLRFIKQTKIFAIPETMIDSITQCSKVQGKKDPPQRKEVLQSDIVNSRGFHEVSKRIRSILEDRMKKVLSFIIANSKYSPSYLEKMIWSTEAVYGRWQNLFLILLWSLVKDDTFLSCTTIKHLEDHLIGNDMMGTEDMMAWLAYDFTFKAEDLTKAVSTLQFLRESANIVVPQRVLKIVLSLPRISNLAPFDDFLWSQDETIDEIPVVSSSGIPEQSQDKVMEEIPVVSSTCLQELVTQSQGDMEEIPVASSSGLQEKVTQDVKLPIQISSKGSTGTAQIPQDIIVVLEDKVSNLADSQSVSQDVIEISDDEIDDKDRLYPKLSRLYEKELVSKRILEQALEEQRKMLRDQENLVIGAIETITRRLDTSAELLSSKAPLLQKKQKAGQSKAKKNRKSQEALNVPVKKVRDTPLDKNNTKDPAPQPLPVSRQSRKEVHLREKTKKTDALSMPACGKETPSKTKPRRGPPRRGSAPNILNKSENLSPSKNVKKTPPSKNLNKPESNKKPLPSNEKKNTRITRSRVSTL